MCENSSVTSLAIYHQKEDKYPMNPLSIRDRHFTWTSIQITQKAEFFAWGLNQPGMVEADFSCGSLFTFGAPQP